METAPDAVEEFSHTSSPGPDMAAVLYAVYILTHHSSFRSNE